MPLLLCIFLARSQLLPCFLCADTSSAVTWNCFHLVNTFFLGVCFFYTCLSCVSTSADAVEWDMGCMLPLQLVLTFPNGLPWYYCCVWGEPKQPRTGTFIHHQYFLASTRFVLEQKMHSNLRKYVPMLNVYSDFLIVRFLFFKKKHSHKFGNVSQGEAGFS